MEEFLTNYTGVLMIVSHDRYLLDKLTDQLFIVEEAGNVRIYNGNYSSFRLELEEQKQQVKKEVAAPVATPSSKGKLSFKEQKELDTLNIEIPLLEAEIKQLNERLYSGIDNAAILETNASLNKANAALDDKTMRWMALTEQNEG